MHFCLSNIPETTAWKVCLMNVAWELKSCSGPEPVILYRLRT